MHTDFTDAEWEFLNASGAKITKIAKKDRGNEGRGMNGRGMGMRRGGQA